MHKNVKMDDIDEVENPSHNFETRKKREQNLLFGHIFASSTKRTRGRVAFALVSSAQNITDKSKQQMNTIINNIILKQNIYIYMSS